MSQFFRTRHDEHPMNKRRLPPLNAVRAFESAARNLSFAKAADELHVTQSAISQQVKLLETWLGNHLFVRLNNGLTLTDKGRHYLPQLKQAFDIINDATESLHDQWRGVTLTLSVLPNFAMHWLLPRLAEFSGAHPWIDLRITAAALPLDQLYETCDLAIRPYERDALHRFDWICSAQMMPVMTEGFARMHGVSAPRDLVRAPRLHISHSPEDWQRWLAPLGIKDSAPDKGTVFDSHAVALEATCLGLGAMMGQVPFVNKMIESGRLVAPFATAVDANRSWYLVSPRGDLSPKATAFRDWILQAVQAEAPGDAS